MAGTANSGAFSKRGTFVLVLFAILAFVTFLYLVGQGGLAGNTNDGRAHAASTGLNGFAGLTRLLEADGYPVIRSRDTAALDDPGLLVLTPPAEMDPEELTEIVDRRRTIGPTMIVAPKWLALPASQRGAKPGWVHLLGAPEEWSATIDGKELTFTRTTLDGRTARWAGLGAKGTLPSDQAILTVSSDTAKDFVAPLVVDGKDRPLVAYLADDGSYLDGDLYLDPVRTDGQAVFGVMLVAEPDLLNNWGLADETRAMLALDLVRIARQGTEDPVRFDLTLNGLGAARNLLTLAFEPPFLAATLTLLIALAIALWRGFARFGPALRPAPAIAPGKSQLIANGAQVIARSRRLRLLRDPYEALMRARIARKLGLKDSDSDAIEAALAARDAPSLLHRLQTLRAARQRGDLLRAARSLRDLERTL
ncbi:DUF4350 domain-containing protein [Citromicrobium bathyomarinum]|uniref:DUF4350 domain-containing protein n=1 Tax=Citromicrobium bathyomarinum TaxID=72174 RepID=UPI00315B0C7B